MPDRNKLPLDLDEQEIRQSQARLARLGISASPDEIREMHSHVLPRPSGDERVHYIKTGLDPELTTALFALQSAKLTVSCIGALSRADLRLGGGCAFLSFAEMGTALQYLVVYAAADVALVFDSAGIDLLHVLQARATRDADTSAMRNRLSELWRRLKVPILSIRNNLAHHAPYSPEGHNHGMESLDRVTFRDLLTLLALAEFCTNALMEPVDEAGLADLRVYCDRIQRDEASNWTLNQPSIWSVYPSLGHYFSRAMRWPGSIYTLAFRSLLDRLERRRSREQLDWQVAPDAPTMVLGVYGTNCSAALSLLYAALLREDVGCGKDRFLGGPFIRALARIRVLKLFYASVVRLFEPGRVNIISSAKANWSVLPLTARSLFATYLWPLWRARESDLRAFRNSGGYHFTSTDRSAAAWMRLQERLHHNTVQALLYMAHAFLCHCRADAIGLPLLHPHPSIAPSFAFDPRHDMSVYDKLLGGQFLKSVDFALILQHQPPRRSAEFPLRTEREAVVDAAEATT